MELREPADASHTALIEAMRRGDRVAWGSFAAHFRPLLEAYARKARIPRWEWPVCITEVLDDEALRLSRPDTELPVNLGAYLVRAVHHRYLRLKRSMACRDRNYDAASDEHAGEWVVRTACSEEALRLSAGPEAREVPLSGSLRRLASELRAGLTRQEETILIWVSEGVSHRQIAEWLGTSYDASTKRIWRLCRKLRMRAAERAAEYSVIERREVERFLRRARTIDNELCASELPHRRGRADHEIETAANAAAPKRRTAGHAH